MVGLNILAFIGVVESGTVRPYIDVDFCID